ncbi:alkaline phosphatase family protein, partial [Mycobacterium tuberculosis]|uniref:alkaline phosphatase family protein n=1 Tax=Mycobacterium tuberculosis TaxID=1773 RepID=UPI0025462B09
RSSGGYLLDEPPDMTPSFPRTGVSGHAGAVHVISPYSRGPQMVHDTFDHTSQLRLLETRFGVPVPNLTAWRRSVTGDMTSTFNFAVPPNSSWPNLDYPGLHALSTVPQCVPNAALGTINRGIPYRVPDPQIMPTQETTPTRGIPSGPC